MTAITAKKIAESPVVGEVAGSVFSDSVTSGSFTGLPKVPSAFLRMVLDPSSAASLMR